MSMMLLPEIDRCEAGFVSEEPLSCRPAYGGSVRCVALGTLCHAVEHLLVSRQFDGLGCGVGPEREAVGILMRLSRSLFMERLC